MVTGTGLARVVRRRDLARLEHFLCPHRGPHLVSRGVYTCRRHVMGTLPAGRSKLEAPACAARVMQPKTKACATAATQQPPPASLLELATASANGQMLDTIQAMMLAAAGAGATQQLPAPATAASSSSSSAPVPSLTVLACQPLDAIDGPESFKSYSDAFKWANAQSNITILNPRSL